MRRDFLLPDLGEGLEDATVVRWHVQVGDTVHLNDRLVTVETTKASVELPSPFEGRVALLNIGEGDGLRVGELLACIDTAEDGEAVALRASGAAPLPTTATTGSLPHQPVLVGYGVDDGPQRATGRREWRRRQGPGGRALGEGEQGPDTIPSAPAAPPDGLPVPRPLAKPPVRWLARTLDVDLHQVRPTGSRGEVTVEDVRAAAGSAATGDAAGSVGVAHGDGMRQDERPRWPSGTGASGPAGDDRQEEIPVRGVRARIAERMSLSRSTIPEAAAGLWVDCERLLALRAALRDDGQSGFEREGRRTEALTPFAILAWMVPFALRSAPVLNASFDAAAKVIRVSRAVHLGVATSTELGLLVPVVRGAHALGLREFARELARLTRSAREGTVTPAELTGSTFTITNYGALGLDDGLPVINAPEAAILGVGAIAPRATVDDGELAVRSTAKLTCVFDHRVSDGADAARFLGRLKTLVEQPALLLGTR